MVECLPSKCEILRSNMPPSKKERQQEEMTCIYNTSKIIKCLELILRFFPWQQGGLNSGPHTC
jgi:hypothetical protein